MARIWLLIICLVSCAAPPVSAQPATAPASDTGTGAEALPSIDDLQQMLDDKKFQQVIRQTSQLLAMTGKAGDAYNHFDLLKLKAEAQLQSGNTTAALTTLAELGRATNDSHQKDLVAATIVLIHRSPRGKYLPKTLPAGKDKPEPIDILDPLTRKAAFEALFNDEREIIDPKIKTAMNGQTVPPILPAIEAIKGLRILDVAATGTDQRTNDVAVKLAEHAKKIMTDALDQMQRRVEEIKRSANTEVVNVQTILVAGVPQQIESRRKQGLTDRNQQELHGMISTCDKIAPVAESLTKGATPPLDVQDVLNNSKEIQAKARDLLDTHF